MRDLSPGFLHALALRLPPLTVQSISMSNHQWIVRCVDIHDLSAFCPICSAACVRYGYLPARKIRHANFYDVAVYLEYQQPRIRCPIHGVHTAKQILFAKGCNVTYDFEACVLRYIVEVEDVTSVMQRFGLGRRMIDRIIQRAVAKHKSTNANNLSLATKCDIDDS
jgi:transposase